MRTSRASRARCEKAILGLPSQAVAPVHEAPGARRDQVRHSGLRRLPEAGSVAQHSVVALVALVAVPRLVVAVAIAPASVRAAVLRVPAVLQKAAAAARPEPEQAARREGADASARQMGDHAL